MPPCLALILLLFYFCFLNTGSGNQSQSPKESIFPVQLSLRGPVMVTLDCHFNGIWKHLGHEPLGMPAKTCSGRFNRERRSSLSVGTISRTHGLNFIKERRPAASRSCCLAFLPATMDRLPWHTKSRKEAFLESLWSGVLMVTRKGTHTPGSVHL